MTLASRITKNAGLQTYFIIKFLVDRNLQERCFKAYAYFRWLDDEIDTNDVPRSFLNRQKAIIQASYRGKSPANLTPQESLIAELIASDPSPRSLLASYILNLFAIIEFDYNRKHKRVSKKKLVWYTKTLSKAVTDALEYFIDHGVPSPKTKNRYDAAAAAHLVHMYRDRVEDSNEGFHNGYISPALVQKYFTSGKAYIRTIPSRKRRIAATLYCKRFEHIPIKNTARIIGAGIGGIATAIQLARCGYKVAVFEKNSKPGGRCGRIVKDGHVFDTGPTMYLFPEIYKNFFASIGEDISKHLDLHRVDPIYTLHYGDGSTFTFSTDRTAMHRQLEAIERGSSARFSDYLDASKKHYDLAMHNITTKPLDRASDYFTVGNLVGFLTSGALTNHVSFAEKYFRDPRLIAAFTFQDSYVSLHPFTAPAVFSLLSYSEFTQGSMLPRGGMYQIVKALTAIASSYGVTFTYNSPVDQINPRDADYIVVNKEVFRPGKQYSCSALTFHWALDHKVPGLTTHNLYFSPSYKKGFDDVLESWKPPEEPHIYVQAPTRTDTSRAPKGEDTLTVIIPINHLDDAHPVDWTAYTRRVRRYIFSKIPGVNGHIKHETVVSPLDWRNKINLPYGSIYGMHHNIAQMGYLRGPRQDKIHKNVYYVGAGTHPGSGLPTVLLSSQFTAQKILSDR